MLVTKKMKRFDEVVAKIRPEGCGDVGQTLFEAGAALAQRFDAGEMHTSAPAPHVEHGGSRATLWASYGDGGDDIIIKYQAIPIMFAWGS